MKDNIVDIFAKQNQKIEEQLAGAVKELNRQKAKQSKAAKRATKKQKGEQAVKIHAKVAKAKKKTKKKSPPDLKIVKP